MSGIGRRLLELFSLAHRHQRRLDEERAERDLKILRAGGWTCHACGDARPDELIAMRSAVVAGGVQHIRWYCVDRPECVDEVAAQLDKIRREADQWKEQS